MLCRPLMCCPGHIDRKGRGNMAYISPVDVEQLSLCEALDRILNKGAVLCGDIRISVANVDLLYLGLQVVLCSVAALKDSGEPVEFQNRPH